MYPSCAIDKEIFLDELHTVKDGKYGSENPQAKGDWNGLVGEITRKVGR